MTEPKPAFTLAGPKRRARTLAQEVVAELTDAIRGGQLKVGGKLPTESEIMNSMGVSRTVVREALSHLQASGLVETRHGIGTFVLAPPTANAPFRIGPGAVLTAIDILAMLELRISLEAEAAALAAVRRNDAHLADMRQALTALQATVAAGGDSVESDFNFHLTVARATGNRYFTDMMMHLGNALIPRSRLQVEGAARRQYLDRLELEHESIFDAIARGDAEGARVAMRMHLTNSRERLRAASESVPASHG